MIRVTIQGPPIQPILNDLAAIPGRIITACAGAVRKSLDEIKSKSRNEYLSGPRPVKLGVVTGNLKRSIQSTVFQGGMQVTGTVFSGTPYSFYHEMGFRGRRITSVRGKLGKSGMVNYAGRPFLWPAFAGHIPSVTNNLLEALRNA